MIRPNAKCRYIDLLFKIAEGHPIKYVWFDPKFGDVFTYDENFGAYRNSRGQYLSSMFFERQMLVPSVWFYQEGLDEI